MPNMIQQACGVAWNKIFMLGTEHRREEMTESTPNLNLERAMVCITQEECQMRFHTEPKANNFNSALGRNPPLNVVHYMHDNIKHR